MIRALALQPHKELWEARNEEGLVCGFNISATFLDLKVESFRMYTFSLGVTVQRVRMYIIKATADDDLAEQYTCSSRARSIMYGVLVRSALLHSEFRQKFLKL